MERIRGAAAAGPHAMPGPSGDGAVLDAADERVAQAMGALLRLRLDTVVDARRGRDGRALASSFELSQVVGLFLKIREPDRRRQCLATLRSYATSEPTDGR